MSTPTPAELYPNDPMWHLEQDVFKARRVSGALRAVQVLVQPYRFSEEEEPKAIECLHREDLAQLLEVLQSDLATRLDQIEGHVEVLQGYQRLGTTALVKARGR